MQQQPPEFDREAASHQQLADVEYISSLDLEPEQFMLASTLIISLRAFQRFAAQGLDFDSLTPQFFADFALRGQAAIQAALVQARAKGDGRG